ncbi:MAG TPA: ATP synthase F0 subunit C [Vicinamibacterales bacterium]|jgi:F-type H+-transporting ATPase subunit c|nr:ATP synthase F0 subunit C [Vicinamibacterales bacterium]
MSSAGFVRRAAVVAVTTVLALVVSSPTVWAQAQPAEGAAGGPTGMLLHLFGVAVGLGLIVIGAGMGIGRLAAAAADGIARQPAAADKITAAVNLPLFLLEGVAILGEVFALLVLLLTT